MDYRRYRPDPMLEPFVEWFWTLEFGEPGADPPVQKIVPDGRTELIVHYGVPMVQGREDGSFVPQQRSAFCGQLKRFITLKPQGAGGMIGVRFKPAGASRFFPFSLQEMTGQILDLDSVLGRPGRELTEQVVNAPGNAHRLALLRDFLVARMGRGREDPVLRAAAAYLEGRRESWTLDSLSERLGYSPRQVERRFKEGVGLSPMALWRVLRFQRFLRLSAASPGASLTDLALECGYYDQSHLIRDFKAIAGSPPSTFFREPHEMSDQITLSR